MAHAAATAERDSALGSAHQPWNSAAAGWNQHGDLIHEWLQHITQTMLDDARIGPGAGFWTLPQARVTRR